MRAHSPGAEEAAMKLSERRILTTHAGSLPRPRALTELYARRAAGEPVDLALLDREARAAVRWSLARQREAGIDVPNNGEQTREAFFRYVTHRMSGFGGRWARKPFADTLRYPEYAAQLRAYFAGRTMVTNREPPVAQAAVRYADRGPLDAELADFRAALAELGGFAEAFMTAPSPGIVATAMRNDVYATEDEYLAALADALKVEYEAAARAGFVLQIDAPDLAMERHIAYADRPLEEFLDFVRRVVAAINRALVNVPAEQVRLHVCWGNYEGPHDLDVPLEAVLPALLEARVGALVLPFANPRHQHEPDVLKRLPLKPGQALVAGVIDTTTNYVEHPEVVAERLVRCAEAVGDPLRVLACTDCGFDTAAGMGRVATDVVWAKLRAMREGAELASRRLF
jgi:5-methyltetrahydropteroyltriglutamate--homocysteine methyltransferase